jgi:putative FmdB family regulatory protein
MPIYEYRCGDCGKKIEILQTMAQGEPANCPSCGGTSLTRVMSVAFTPRSKTSDPGMCHTCCEEERKEGCVPGMCCNN